MEFLALHQTGKIAVDQEKVIGAVFVQVEAVAVFCAKAAEVGQ